MSIFFEEGYEQVRSKLRLLEFMLGQFKGTKRIWNEFGDESISTEDIFNGTWRLSKLHFQETLGSLPDHDEKVLSLWSYDLLKQAYVRWSFSAYSFEPRLWVGDFDGAQPVMMEQDVHQPKRWVFEPKEKGIFVVAGHGPARSSSGYYKGTETIFEREYEKSC